jgi:hypothetical protein
MCNKECILPLLTTLLTLRYTIRYCKITALSQYPEELDLCFVFNPLPVQFKSLLPGQEGCVFFQWAFKYTYLPLRFTTLRPAKG